MHSSRSTPGSVDEAYEHAPCGLIRTRTDGTIVRVNATFCRWLAVDAAELLGQRRIQDLLTMGGRVFHQTHWAPLLQIQRSVAEVKLEFRHRDGQKVAMLINAVRRWHADAEFDDFACMVVHDRHKYEKELVHTRRRAEDALEAKTAAEQALSLANRHKDEFLATLAHELRNPLSPIQAAVTLLARKEFADPEIRWSRGVLQRQLAQLVRLVDDLMDVARIAEGKFELRLQHVNMAAVLQTAIEGSKELLRAQSHKFVADLPDSPIYLDVDPARLVQIVQNLLNNAAKYTPPGGLIELEVHRDDAAAIISVRDTGIGFAAGSSPSLFTMFSQLPSGHSRAQGGLGIGLALVRALSEAHGGTVNATSPGVDQGSEFTVRLPLSSSQHAPADDSVTASPITREKRRILVVDDSEDTALSLCMLLEADGFETRTAITGSAAISMAIHADVILLDIGLPDIDGYAVARQIRSDPRCSGVLLIAVTGWSQDRDRQAAVEAGFDHHLVKPVDYTRLLSMLG
ncbi:ATP-binding protein [Caballeronia glebae]